jgi:hypothetical protein
MNYHIEYVKDILDNNYLGVKISKSRIKPFLDDLKDILGEEDYNKFTENQQKRDRNSYHITVINVMEYNSLSKKDFDGFINSLEKVFDYSIDDLKMKGVGVAQRNENTAYFIVCESNKLDAVRTRYGLKERDFHITIGFKSKDVFGVRKNVVIDKKSKFKSLLADHFYKKNNFEFVKDIGNYNLSKDCDIIPLYIDDSYLKVKCDEYTMDIGFLETEEKFWIMTKYIDKDELPEMGKKEIDSILKK